MEKSKTIASDEGYLTLPDEEFVCIADSDFNNEQIARPSITYWRDVWNRYKKDKLALAGMTIIVIIALAAIFGPLISPYTYDGQDIMNGNQTMSATHWFGTDKFGRDIFVRVLYGARISLTIGVVAALISTVFGILYGGIAGYVGGKTDNIMMRIVDVLISLPSLLYTILIMMFLGSNIQSILIALCFSSWIGTSRVVRAEVLRLKHQEYVLAARLCGTNSKGILLRHLIPNSMGPIIVSTAFLIPTAIFSEAFLSFLGIGIQIPMASWGTLANEAIPVITTQPYQMLFPVLAISITMFSFNFIGDGLRDALDPRLKK